jgi:hypothetical protein
MLRNQEKMITKGFTLVNTNNRKPISRVVNMTEEEYKEAEKLSNAMYEQLLKENS